MLHPCGPAPTSRHWPTPLVSGELHPDPWNPSSGQAEMQCSSPAQVSRKARIALPSAIAKGPGPPGFDAPTAGYSSLTIPDAHLVRHWQDSSSSLDLMSSTRLRINSRHVHDKGDLPTGSHLLSNGPFFYPGQEACRQRKNQLVLDTDVLLVHAGKTRN